MTHLRTCASMTVALAAVLLCMALTVPSTAGATSTRGITGGNEAVSSGTWAAMAATTAMTFTTNTDQTSTVANTGTIALSAISYKVTISNPTSGLSHLQDLRLRGGLGVQQVQWRCGNAGRWNPGQELDHHGELDGGAAAQRHAYLQVEPASITSTVTVTLATLILSPSQLRAAIKTNQ